jgi:hypothetical protein
MFSIGYNKIETKPKMGGRGGGVEAPGNFTFLGLYKDPCINSSFIKFVELHVNKLVEHPYPDLFILSDLLHEVCSTTAVVVCLESVAWCT